MTPSPAPPAGPRRPLLALPLVAWALIAPGCIESRLDGIECLNDGDCPARRVCDVVAAACRTALSAVDGGADGGRPDGGRPDGRPVEDPGADPLAEWCTRHGARAWPDAIVLLPGRDPTRPDVERVIDEAVASMAGASVALCDVDEAVGGALDRRDDARPIVIGPVVFDTRLQGVAAEIARRSVWIRNDPLPSMQPGWWSVQPATVDLVPALAALLGEPPADTVLVTRVGRIGEELDARLADALCGDGPCFERRLDSSDDPIGGAALVLADAQNPQNAERVVCAVGGQLDGPQSAPPVLMLDGPLDPLTFRRLWETDRPCDGRIDPAALCPMRTLSARGGGAFAVGPNSNRAATARDGRLHDALRLADLARRLAERDLAPGEPASRDALDEAMRALLTPGEADGDAAPLLLDGSGWREAVRRIDAGEAMPPLVGAAANSMPDPETRRPAVERLWLRRFSVDRAQPVAVGDTRVYDVHRPVDPQVFAELMRGADCVQPE